METVEAISKEIQNLNEVIANVIHRVEDRAARLEFKPEERLKMLAELQTSDGWRERASRLEQ